MMTKTCQEQAGRFTLGRTWECFIVCCHVCVLTNADVREKAKRRLMMNDLVLQVIQQDTGSALRMYVDLRSCNKISTFTNNTPTATICSGMLGSEMGYV